MPDAKPARVGPRHAVSLVAHWLAGRIVGPAGAGQDHTVGNTGRSIVARIGCVIVSIKIMITCYE